MPTNPDETFVPLTRKALSASERPDFRVTVVSPSAPATSPAPPSPGAWSALPAAAAEPRVTLQRDGDRVSAIRIQCACGRLIELACVYDDIQAPAPAPAAGVEARPGPSAKV